MTASDEPDNPDYEHRPLLAKTVSFRALFFKNWFSTCVYCSVFCTFGICVAILGPTLTDLGCLTRSDIRAMSWVFFAQFLFVLVGSMLSGYLVNRRCLTLYQADLLIFGATVGLPVLMFIVPLCRVIGVMAVVLALMGLCMGCLDCLANVQMIKLFGEAVTPFLQAMHFFYGLGAFLSPMIAEPFLYNADCSTFLHEINNMTDSTDTFTMRHSYRHRYRINSTFVEEELEHAAEGTHIKYAYWIIAAIMVPIPFLVGIMIVKRRDPDIEHKKLIESDSSTSLELSSSDESSEKKGSWSQSSRPCFTNSDTETMQITIGMAAMLFIYDGLQSSYGAYVYSYAVKSIDDLAKSEGAYLNASFWGAFAAGRLISIFIAAWFSPAFMLLTNTVGSFLSMILMLWLSHDHVALYVGTCLFGLFLSSVTPTALSLAEQYVDLSSSNTALIVTLAATGEMVMPVVVGNAFGSFGPSSFLVSGAIMTFASLFVFAFVILKGRQSPKIASLEDRSFIWCQSYILKRKSRKSKKNRRRKEDPNNVFEMTEPKPE